MQRLASLVLPFALSAAIAFAEGDVGPRTAAVSVSADAAAISIVEPPFKPPQTWIYTPQSLTVKVGTTVTWANSGAVVHTVTADDSKAFNSGNIAPKAKFTLPTSVAGTFSYHCAYHPWMKGTLVVVP